LVLRQIRAQTVDPFADDAAASFLDLASSIELRPRLVGIWMPTMWRDARIIFSKDLAVERRAKVALRQVLPFVFTIVLLFGFALDRVLIQDPLVSSDTVPVPFVAPGVFWLAVLFSSVLLIQRSIGVEIDDGAWDQLRLWGMDPAGVFLGKTAAMALQLLFIELVLAVAVVLAFGVTVPTGGAAIAIISIVVVAATIALSATASAYGALSAGIRGRETLIPVLLLPVAVPVLLASVQSWQGVLTADIGAGWAWARLVALFAVIYLAVGVLAYGALMEE
jgi:heme exporter protein B